jgi:hypothetical protein
MLPVFLTSNGLYDDAVFSQFNKLLQKYNVERRICLITTAIRDTENRRFHTNKTTEQLTNAGFIGGKIAATILSEIGEIHRFNHAKKLVAFAGIDPVSILQESSPLLRIGLRNVDQKI